jgi:membrane protein DedA with SNARE-associated domain
MHEIIHMIKQWGPAFYGLAFLWTLLEGETFVIFAGVAANKGILRLDGLIAVSWLGSFLGDQIYFFLGRCFGKRLLRRFPRLEPGVAMALVWLERWDSRFILSYRFIYGIRNFASIALGMSAVPWRHFLILNFIAAGLWSVLFAGGGYLCGRTLGGVLANSVTGFMIGTFGLFAAVIAVKVILHRRGAAKSRAVIPPQTDISCV